MSRESRQWRREEEVRLVRSRIVSRWCRWGILVFFVISAVAACTFRWWERARPTPVKNSFAVKFAGGGVLPTNYTSLCLVKTNDLEYCDIALMNLLCAEGLRGAENLDVRECLNRLDAIAQYVKSETDRHLYKFHEHPAEYNHSEG